MEIKTLKKSNWYYWVQIVYLNKNLDYVDNICKYRKYSFFSFIALLMMPLASINFLLKKNYKKQNNNKLNAIWIVSKFLGFLGVFFFMLFSENLILPIQDYYLLYYLCYPILGIIVTGIIVIIISCIQEIEKFFKNNFKRNKNRKIKETKTKKPNAFREMIKSWKNGICYKIKFED